MAFFALTMVSGPGWDTSRGRREQREWDAHAMFMDELVDDGFVVLGGPIGDGERALVVVEAADAGEVEARLAQDPWAAIGVLQIGEMWPWTIWLDGTRRRTAAPPELQPSNTPSHP